MPTITSRLHDKQRNSLLSLGGVYLVMGIVHVFYKGTLDSAVGYIYFIIGICFLVILAYQIKKKKLFSSITWDENYIHLKGAGTQKISFALSEIKTLKITDKSLTINAGMGNGEMIDLDYFKKKDIELLKNAHLGINAQSFLAS